MNKIFLKPTFPNVYTLFIDHFYAIDDGFQLVILNFGNNNCKRNENKRMIF